jgi:hypothetical protein
MRCHGTCRCANKVRSPNIESEYVFPVKEGQPESVSFVDQAFPAAPGMPPLELMPEMQEVDLERFEGIKRFLLYLADRPSS